MIETIQKRNGNIVPFDSTKIKSAITKANRAVDNDAIPLEDISCLTESVCNNLSPDTLWTVEQIQDIVEDVLIRSGHARTAKAYILYRAEHSKIRQSESDLMDIYQRLTYADAKDEDIKRENANIDGDTAMGTMLKYGSEGAKYFVDNYILPKDVALAHSNGDIHIHDKDFYMLTETCCQIDLIKLFKNGFSTGHGYLREPNSIRSYAALACIAIQSNQNEMHGGQSVPNFDYAMAQGVKKTYYKEYFKMMKTYLEVKFEIDEEKIDSLITAMKDSIDFEFSMAEGDRFEEMLCELSLSPLSQQQWREAHRFSFKEAINHTNKHTYQSMEALIHNLNTMNSRAGAQVPFSSINYGTDTSLEGKMVTRNILEATIAGMGDGETPIFPVQIFKVKEGVNYNPEDPNYDLFKLAIKSSAIRLFPNFSFIDAPYNLQYYKEGDYNTEIAYMGCRTRVISNHYDNTKETISGRGNLSFTSINLPRLGIMAKGDLDLFYELLEDRIQLVKRQLLHRFKIQCSKKVRNYPFLMGQHVWLDSDDLDPDDSVAEVLKHGTLSVGFIGLAETLKALTGKHHGESAESQKLGLEIIGFMRKRMDELSEETGLNFSLLATPAEGLSGRFVSIDKKKFGSIEGVTSRDYYTNSFHVPVYFPIKAYQKIQLEAPYHELTNAGHISYVELDGDTSKNLEAFETIIRFMKETGIGYGSINHPVDRDPVCGYTGIIDEVCPRCGRRVGEPITLEKLKELQEKYRNVPQH
ncbi:MAG TPA: anaerobic ribonucleoside triphosphate reductase [Candidatus Pelethocola excrementipullorum]|nr:anaerobic ribonucleoside triphosphate reductase [Candidatus Pelethocola excrementipullorum]